MKENIGGMFGAMNLNTQPAQQQAQAQQAAQTTQKPAQPQAAAKKKDDAWSMAGGLIDLDKNFGKADPKYAAKPVAVQQANLPNLSSYGNQKPDLTGFSSLGNLTGQMGMGQPMQAQQRQQQPMGQMGGGMGFQQPMAQQRPMGGMGGMGGMGQMGGMGMGQPQQMGMSQMGMGRQPMQQPM